MTRRVLQCWNGWQPEEYCIIYYIIFKYLYFSFSLFFCKYLVGRGKLFLRLKRLSLISGYQVQSETQTTPPRAGLAESQDKTNASFVLLLSSPKDSSSNLVLKVFNSNNLAANLITCTLECLLPLSFSISSSFFASYRSLLNLQSTYVMFGLWLIIVNKKIIVIIIKR